MTLASAGVQSGPDRAASVTADFVGWIEVLGVCGAALEDVGAVMAANAMAKAVQ
jgi:hypothetical protein